MAISMPSIEIKFTQLAVSLIERSSRGMAILIIKDDTDKEFDYKVYTDSAAVDKDKKKFTSENLRYIKDILNFQVNKCYVFRMDTENTLSDILSKIEKRVKSGWITIADGTSDEFESLASWIKSKELQNKTYKAVTYKVNVTDCKHIVNFYNDKIKFSDNRGEVSGEKYCPSLIGILASCNVKRGCTYFKCQNLISVEEVEDNDEAVGNGKFILFNDEDVVKVARGINSLTTTDGLNNTEDMKYIDNVETMDLILDDITRVFKEEYLGNYKNNYDNQILFISAINTYFKTLSREYILDNNYDNRADVNVNNQRDAWIGVGKTEAAEWDDQTVKDNSFKHTVFLCGYIKILGSMEDLSFDVSIF